MSMFDCLSRNSTSPSSPSFSFSSFYCKYWSSCSLFKCLFLFIHCRVAVCSQVCTCWFWLSSCWTSLARGREDLGCMRPSRPCRVLCGEAMSTLAVGGTCIIDRILWPLKLKRRMQVELNFSEACQSSSAAFCFCRT